jgi:hypothetical protein
MDAVQSLGVVNKVASLAQLILCDIILSSAGDLPLGVRIGGDRAMAVCAQQLIRVDGSGVYRGVNGE